MCAAPVGESREGGRRYFKTITNAAADFITGFRFKEPSRPFEVYVSSSSSRVPTEWTVSSCLVECFDGEVIVSLEFPSNDVHWRFEFLSSTDFLVPDLLPNLYEARDSLAAAKIIGDSSVALLGCARNCVDVIESVIENLEEIGSRFKSFRVCVFENDSVDGTSELLQEMSKKKDLDLFQERNLDAVFPLRTQRLSYGRNKLFRHALTYSPTYVVVVDLDGVVDYSRIYDGILSCMMLPDVWDAVFPVNSGEYFDLWALRHSKIFPHDYEFFMNDLPPVLQQRSVIDYVMRAQKQLDFKSMGGWLRIESAFGGIGVYKTDAFRFSSYRGDDERGVRRCEHVMFHSASPSYKKRLFINPQFIV